MHTLSSARRTCMASASAVECTATVAMPSSLQARSMRSAISPRLAIRILSNMRKERLALLDDGERLGIFDGLAVIDEDREHGAGMRSRDMVHGLHGLDDEDGLARGNLGAGFDERRGAWLRRAIGGADHGRVHRAGVMTLLLAASLAGLARPASGIDRESAGADRDGPRHAHALAFMLDFDLGETGLLEQIGKLADEVLVEGPFLFGHALALFGHQRAFFGSSEAARASMASS